MRTYFTTISSTVLLALGLSTAMAENGPCTDFNLYNNTEQPLFLTPEYWECDSNTGGPDGSEVDYMSKTFRIGPHQTKQLLRIFSSAACSPARLTFKVTRNNRLVSRLELTTNSHTSTAGYQYSNPDLEGSLVVTSHIARICAY